MDIEKKLRLSDIARRRRYYLPEARERVKEMDAESASLIISGIIRKYFDRDPMKPGYYFVAACEEKFGKKFINDLKNRAAAEKLFAWVNKEDANEAD